LVSLLENGTHVLFGTEMGSYCTSELALAEKVIARLQPGMLCLADRVFTGGQMWKRATATGADLLWRCQLKMNFACAQRLEDGSYLSYVYPRRQDRIRCPHNESRRIPIRVIEYRLRGGSEKDPFYRLLTTILDPQKAPACELAALYHERWEIENTLDEFKVHLRGAQVVLRSQTPDLVRQEFYAFLMLHFAVRSFMHEAARSVDRDPDELSFVHAVRVLRRHVPLFIISPHQRTRNPLPSHPAGDRSRKAAAKSRTTHPSRRQAKNEPVSASSTDTPLLASHRLCYCTGDS